jgi:hypothetical protein
MIAVVDGFVPMTENREPSKRKKNEKSIMM